MVGEYFQGYIPLRQTGEDNWVIPASRGSAPWSNRIWNIILRSPKQQIWLRTALCWGWCRRMALRNRELHATNDDHDDIPGILFFRSWMATLITFSSACIFFWGAVWHFTLEKLLPSPLTTGHILYHFCCVTQRSMADAMEQSLSVCLPPHSCIVSKWVNIRKLFHLLVDWRFCFLDTKYCGESLMGALSAGKKLWFWPMSLFISETVQDATIVNVESL